MKKLNAIMRESFKWFGLIWVEVRRMVSKVKKKFLTPFSSKPFESHSGQKKKDSETEKWLDLQSILSLQELTDFSSDLKLDKNRFKSEKRDQIPLSVKRFLPLHDPGALLIMTWTGGIEKGENNDHHFMIGKLKWINKSFRSFLLNSFDFSYSSLKDNKWFSGEKSEIKVVELLSAIGANLDSRNTLLGFYEALLEVPGKYLFGKTLNEIQKKSGFDITHQLDEFIPQTVPPPQNAKIKTFKWISYPQNSNTGKSPGAPHLVVGARIESLSGVELLVRKEHAQHVANWYDVYAVFQLEHADLNVPLEESNLIAIQGIFIPVESRHKLLSKWNRDKIQAQAAGLVARNLSHNIGSHAIPEIARLLKTGKGASPLPGELAKFLDYLAIRADLVAHLASNSLTPFRVSISFEALFDEFDAQSLLRASLCKTEGCKCNTIAVKMEKSLITSSLMVDIPGGILGQHAVYALIENFVRNSAKHDSRFRTQPIISPIVKISVFNSELFETILYDRYGSIVDKKLVDSLNELLNRGRSIGQMATDKADKTTSFSLGMMEMLIWAAYLRGHNLHEVLVKDPNPKTLEYCIGPNGKLGLKFYLIRGQILRKTSSVQIGFSQYWLLEFNGNTKGFADQLKGRWVAINWKRKDSSPIATTRFGHCSATTLYSSEHQLPNRVQGLFIKTLMEYSFPSKGIQKKKHDLEGERLSLIFIDQSLLNILLDEKDKEKNQELHLFSFQEVQLELRNKALLEERVGVLRFHLPEANFDAYIISEVLASNPQSMNKCIPKSCKLAIWAKHGTMIRDIHHQTLSNSIKKRIIHMEFYNFENFRDEKTPHRFRFTGYGELITSLFRSKSYSFEMVLGFFAEAALSKIRIVDERISKLFEDDHNLMRQLSFAGIQLFNPYGKSNVFWPRDLDESIVESVFEEELPSQHKMPFVFETIHASLKANKGIFPDEDADRCGMQTWDEFIQDRMKSIPYLSVHSGRGGINESDRQGVPFFPLSQIKRYGFDVPCKFLLTQILFRGGITEDMTIKS